MSLWKGWSYSVKGFPVETFVMCLNSAMKAKQDKSQGQKLSGLWNSAASQKEDVFKNIGLRSAKGQLYLGSERSEQKGRGITELLIKITE